MTFIVLNITSHRISWWSGGVVVVHDHVCLPPDQRLADPCSLKSWGGRLLTISHVLTGCSFDLFGQAYDVRLRWIPDILWILQPLFYKGDRLSSTPMAECITGHTFRLHVSSPAQLFAFCAHVRSLRNALFFSVSHICSPFSLTCFSQKNERELWDVIRDLLSDTFQSCLCGRILQVWISSWGMLGVMFRKTMSICELQKHKHMPQEFQENNLASQPELEAPALLFHDLWEEIDPGTPLWRNSTQDRKFRPTWLQESFLFLLLDPHFKFQLFPCCMCRVEHTRKSNRCSLNLQTAVYLALGLVVVLAYSPHICLFY